MLIIHFRNVLIHQRRGPIRENVAVGVIEEDIETIIVDAQDQDQWIEAGAEHHLEMTTETTDLSVKSDNAIARQTLNVVAEDHRRPVRESVTEEQIVTSIAKLDNTCRVCVGGK